MRRKFIQIGFLLLLFSCWQEEYGGSNPEQEDWFQCTDTRVTPIVETMQAIERERPFMAVFHATYGLPLWDYADIYQEAGSGAVHFWVPLYKNDHPNEIRALWYFKLENGLLDYGPVTRDADLIRRHGQDYQFDYLGYHVFGSGNASGMEFRDHPVTRSEYGGYEIVGIECRDAYVTIELNGISTTTYKGTTCREIKVWTDYINDDIFSQSGSGGGGSGSGVPVGGGRDTTEKAQRIFENKNMIDNNWELLEDMIDKIEENCMGEALYNGLVEALDGKKIHIEFIPGRSSGFSAYEQTISIGMDYVQSNGLLHEMFHALQYYTKGKDKFNKSTLNCEIEAHYAQYLYLRSLPEFKGSYWEEMYEQFDYLLNISDLQFFLDQSIQPINNEMLNVQLELIIESFKETEGYSDELIYEYDPSQSGINNFSLLKNLVKNCI